jgi:hypothetical protein
VIDSDDYDEIDQLIDTDPIALGERCRRAEAENERLRAAIRRHRDVQEVGTHHDQVLWKVLVDNAGAGE